MIVAGAINNYLNWGWLTLLAVYTLIVVALYVFAVARRFAPSTIIGGGILAAIALAIPLVIFSLRDEIVDAGVSGGSNSPTLTIPGGIGGAPPAASTPSGG